MDSLFKGVLFLYLMWLFQIVDRVTVHFAMVFSICCKLNLLIFFNTGTLGIFLISALFVVLI